MPSCDGSNCGACACGSREVIIYKDNPETIKKLTSLIELLEKEIEELKKGKNING